MFIPIVLITMTTKTFKNEFALTLVDPKCLISFKLL